MLTFVGAIEIAPASSQAATQLSSTTNVVAGPSTGSSSTLSMPSTSGIVVDGVSVSKDQHSFAGVTHRSVLGGGVTTAPNIREAAVTAFYVDKAEAERRESSFIISGLLPSQSSSDGDLVSALCQEELGMSLDIAFTKRLGKVIPDKVQPLLVYVKQVDQAKLVISSAR